MADPDTVNIKAFQPFDGGNGRRFAATTTSGATAFQVRGLAGGTEGNDQKRVLISNSGSVSAFVRMGPSSVAASLDSLEILPGCAYLLSPPETNPSGLWIAACTEAGTTKVSIVAGVGT